MNGNVALKEMNKLIQDIKSQTMKLIEMSDGIQCVDRNCERILSSLKMLELNISDVVDFIDE